MFNNLAILAGANYISSVRSLQYNNTQDSSLVQLDTNNNIDQKFEVIDPEYYDQANVQAEYNHGGQRFRQYRYGNLYQQSHLLPYYHREFYQPMPHSLSQHRTLTHHRSHGRNVHRQRGHARTVHHVSQRHQTLARKHSATKQHKKHHQQQQKTETHTKRTNAKQPHHSLHDHHDYLDPIEHVHGVQDLFPAKNLKDVFDHVEYNSPVPEREEPDTIGIGGEKEHHEKAHLRIYDNAGEHLNLDPVTLEEDLASIKVYDHGPSTYAKKEGRDLGRRCETKDWVAAHWTAKMDWLGHPKQVENTYQEYGEENPRIFQLGKYETIVCMELATVSMHVDETMKMHCPERLAHGNSEYYAHGDDSFVVPKQTDLDFSYTIIDCQDERSVLEKNVKIWHDNIVGKRKAALEAEKKKLAGAKVEDEEDDKEVTKNMEGKKKEKTEDEKAEETVKDNETPEAKEDQEELNKEKQELKEAKKVAAEAKKAAEKEKKETEAEEQEEAKKEKELEENKDAKVDVNKMAKKNEEILVKKTVAEADEKEAKKIEKKVEKAEKAVKEEEKEVVKEVKTGKVVAMEKEEAKAAEKGKPADAKKEYKTLPAKDVQLKSDFLKDDCAGHYRQSKDHEIHDHPVWIKVKPAIDRFGYYQGGKWHITDLANLEGMLKDQANEPKTNWNNQLQTAINEVEMFFDSIWNDGKKDLEPKAVGDDGTKVVTSAAEEEKEEEEEEKPKKKGAAPAEKPEKKAAAPAAEEKPKKKKAPPAAPEPAKPLPEDKAEEPPKKEPDEEDDKEESPKKEEKKEEEEEEEAAPAKKEAPKAAPAPKEEAPSAAKAKAAQEHDKVQQVKKKAQKKIQKALAKIKAKKAHEGETKAQKVKRVEAQQKKAPKKRAQMMGSNNCFMIEAGTKEPKYLQVATVDKYAPRKTGVFNVYLSPLMADKPLNDPVRALQLWYYNGKRKALLSRRFPSKGLFEGFNKNLIVFKYRGLKNQVWNYDMTHHLWYNVYTHRSLVIEKGSDTNIVTEKIDLKNTRQVFNVVPCKK